MEEYFHTFLKLVTRFEMSGLFQFSNS